MRYFNTVFIALSLWERFRVMGLNIFFYSMLIGCLTACGITTKQPALHDFGIPALTVSGQSKASININAPTWLWDNRIRYRLLYTTPSEVRFYGLHQWIASPPELFEQLLTSKDKMLDYAITIRLQDFEQQFDAPDRARVVINFIVEAYSGDKNQHLGSQMFSLQQPTKTADATGAINGFINLTHQAVGKIQMWLIGLKTQQN